MTPLLCEIERNTVRLHPDQVRPRDCVYAVDLPGGWHLDMPELPEVIGLSHVAARQVTAVAFLDRDAVEWPDAAWLTVYRRGAGTAVA